MWNVMWWRYYMGGAVAHEVMTGRSAGPGKHQRGDMGTWHQRGIAQA